MGHISFSAIAENLISITLCMWNRNHQKNGRGLAQVVHQALPPPRLFDLQPALFVARPRKRNPDMSFCASWFAHVLTPWKCSVVRSLAYKMTQQPPLSRLSTASSAARVAASKTSSTPSPVRELHSRYLRAPISSFMSSPALRVVNF